MKLLFFLSLIVFRPLVIRDPYDKIDLNRASMKAEGVAQAISDLYQISVSNGFL